MSIPAARATRRGLTNVYPPKFRSLNHFTGEVVDRPSAFIRALSEADNFVAELDRVRELQTRIDELHAEIRELQEQLALARAERDAYRMAVTR